MAELTYKHHLVRACSYQRERTGPWLAEARVFWNAGAGISCELKLEWEQTFPTQAVADDYAVEAAKQWIDDGRHGGPLHGL